MNAADTKVAGPKQQIPLALFGRHIETKARRVLVVPRPYTTAIFKYQICNFGLLSVKKERLQRKLSSLEAHRAQRRHSTC
eukprot:scaffold2852_cov189-Alexandrium_tamarense.AAC.8